jgi:hypothetical protein
MKKKNNLRSRHRLLYKKSLIDLREKRSEMKACKNQNEIKKIKKLRTIPVVCLLISTCFFGVIFVTPEQVSATDTTRDDSSKFVNDNWNFESSKMDMSARKFLINQAKTLIFPSFKGMLVGGFIGLTLGTLGILSGGVLTLTAVGMLTGGGIGTAISAGKNIFTYEKSIIDWGFFSGSTDWDSLKGIANIITSPYADINRIPTFNIDNIPKLNIPDVIPTLDTDNIPKLNQDLIPKLNIPDVIPTLDTDNIPKLTTYNIPCFNPR